MDLLVNFYDPESEGHAAPRNRWIKLYSIAYVIAASICGTILIAMQLNTPLKDREPITILSILRIILGYILLYFLCFIVIGIVLASRQFAIRSELDQYREDQAKAHAIRDHKDYPGVTIIPEYSAPTDGPGRYRVEGVNRSTKEGASLDVQADSAANAKVKAELDGIVVTSLTKTA